MSWVYISIVAAGLVIDRPDIESPNKEDWKSFSATAPATIPVKEPPSPTTEPPPAEEPVPATPSTEPDPLNPDQDPTPFQPFEPEPGTPDHDPSELPAPEPGKTFPFCQTTSTISTQGTSYKR